MTVEDELTRIEARAAEATPGPWRKHSFGSPGDQEPSSTVVHTGLFDWDGIYHGENPPVAWLGWDSQDDADAEFIAHARTDVPALVGVVRRLLDLRDEYTRDHEIRAAAGLGVPMLAYWDVIDRLNTIAAGLTADAS